MITSYGRIIIIFILVGLLLVLLPVLAGMGAASFLEDDVPDEDDLSMINDISFTWLRIPLRELSTLLTLGLSVFALFVVYLGGRSKHRRFNDRTIDANTVSIHLSWLLRTAQRRAVFNFFNGLSGLPNNVQLLTEGGIKQ
jgi:hypothetical protein